MISQQIIKTAAFIGQKVYSNPYSSTEGSLFRANFYYKCADSTIIYRPNHNIANILRTLVYLQPVIDYYKINGTDDIREQLISINEAEKEKIRFKKKVFVNMQNYFSSCQSFVPFRNL